MKLKKLLALTLAGAVLTVSLTACTPLDAAELLYDWLFGGGSSSASRGNGTGLVESETLEAVAKGFDATWLTTNNGLNETAVNALKSITDDKLELTQRLCVDVMELTPSGRTAVTIPDNREIYSNSYWDPGPESGGPYYDSCLKNYVQLRTLLSYSHRNGVELYAGTFQKGENTYAAMVIIF